MMVRFQAENVDLQPCCSRGLEQPAGDRWLLQNQRAIASRLLAEIALQVHQSLELQEILDIAVTKVRQLFDCDRVFIYRFTPEWNGQVIAESVADGWKSFLGNLICDSCFCPDWIEPYTKGRIQVVEDIDTANITPCHAALLSQLQIRAKLLVPIVRGGNLWGLMSAVESGSTRKWQPWEIELLQKLATQISLAIQQSQLYRQLQTELEKRQQAELTLKCAREELERQVALRTAELQAANHQLRLEIVERKQVEKCLTAFLREKEILLQEISHRVTNNLQIVSTLLKLQSDSIDDLQIARLFAENQHRLESMVVIYKKLYQTRNLSRINFGDYLAEFIDSFFAAGNNSERISYQINSEPIFLDVNQSIFCGLIVNELVTNTLKYAFSNRENGYIWVRVCRDSANHIKLIVRHNGQEIDWDKSELLGWQLVVAFAQQIDGNLRVSTRDCGTVFQLKFPEINC